MNKKSLIQGDIVSVNGEPHILHYWWNDNTIDVYSISGGGIKNHHSSKVSLLPISVSLLVYLDFEPVLKGEGWTRGGTHVRKSKHGWIVKQGDLPEQNIKYINQLQRYL